MSAFFMARSGPLGDAPLRRLLRMALLAGGSGGAYYTLTGTLPLTLPHSLAAAIRSLVRTGSMTQSPAPTPDAPVYPSINNGTVRYGANGTNLLDMAEENILLRYYINDSGAETSNNQNFYNTKLIPVKPNTAYTLSASAPVYYLSIMEYDSNKGFLQRTLDGSSSEKLSSTTITTRADTAYLRIGSNPNRTAVNMDDVTSLDWMLNEGSTALPYEPYTEGIYTDGDTETLTVFGNLLSRDGETTGKIITSDGTVADNASYCISAPFVLPAGNYTCTWQTGSGSRPFSVFAVDESGTPQPDGKLFYQQSATAGINTGEFTVEAETRVVASYRRNVTDLAIYSNAQTATVPDLYAVGDYTDEVDVVAGTVTRRVGCHVFDGTESFGSYTGNRLVYKMSGRFRNRGGCVCTHFPGASGPNDTTLNTVYAWGITQGSTDVPAIWFRTTDYTASTLKALCAEQFAAGTPLIAWFVLQEPTTESITPQALRTQDGTTVVSSSAGSVGASVEYKASEEPTAAEPTSGLMMAAPVEPESGDGGAADGS